MPKRTIDDRISKYEEKIKELQQKKNSEPPRKRIRIIYSSSDEDDNQGSENAMSNPLQHENQSQMRRERTVEPQSPEATQGDPLQSPIRNNLLGANPGHADPATIAEPEVEPLPSTSKEAPPAAAEVPVEPELLQALGESTDDTPEFGKAIHANLASLWPTLLKKGLSKENKEKLMKSNLIPENCKLLQSPKLNDEISAAVSEIVRGRDKKLSGFQQQLGAGITAVNKGMEILLSGGEKAQALTHLSDGCRLLSDLHFASTKDRRKLIIPSLDKNILHLIQDAERDDTLFGSALSEKIKASKAILRQGQQIKKTVANQATASTSRSSTTSRYAPQGNWRGPPRYQTSRGGRGSQTRSAPTRRPYNTSATTARQPASQAKPRAPTQQ